jgi:hypothetical protein
MDNNNYKTSHSIFTFEEIDAFCNEWGWIHVKEFVKNETWKEHAAPYIWGSEGCGEFIGIDGNKYMTCTTYRFDWIGDIKNDAANKLEFREHLKRIAGDYYGENRDHYYFYDVMLTGDGPYDCYAIKEVLKDYEPNEYALAAHGKPHYTVILAHLGVTNGKSWGRKNLVLDEQELLRVGKKMSDELPYLVQPGKNDIALAQFYNMYINFVTENSLISKS